jgi:hypothetical protein
MWSLFQHQLGQSNYWILQLPSRFLWQKVLAPLNTRSCLYWPRNVIFRRSNSCAIDVLDELVMQLPCLVPVPEQGRRGRPSFRHSRRHLRCKRASQLHSLVYQFIRERKLRLTLFLVHRFLSHWWWRRYVPPKRRFLHEPHGITSQKSPFVLITALTTSNLTKTDPFSET